MLKMKFKSTLKWKYIHHAPTSSSSEDISLQMKEKRNLKISHKNMNVNFKYKDSCNFAEHLQLRFGFWIHLLYITKANFNWNLYMKITVGIQAMSS